MSINIPLIINKINLYKITRLIIFLVVMIPYFMLSKEIVAFEFANYVIDARTGKFLYGKNYKKRLHPASLTKMMTLYLTFNELEKNRINLNDLVTISQNASREPPSKLRLLAGQRVSVRNLIRGAAIRSANDAATALAEYISGSETKFANYMTLTARKMGMSKTVFKNAHGLTNTNHLSTPEDMAILARRLIFDFPQYYNLFGRTSVQALGKIIYNTNRKFLANYSGSDGIKTGFTSSAGYNLAASAARGNVRIIGIVFGGGSVALRNKRMAELLDLGFSRAPKILGSIPLSNLNLSPDMINRIGENGLLDFSSIPLNRPKIFDPIHETTEIVESKQIEEILKDVKSSLLKEIEEDPKVISNSITQSSEQIYLNIPLQRPKILWTNQEFYKSDDIGNSESESIDKATMQILVGFYYNKYNAEKDLPGVLLSDYSLLDNVTAEISKEVFRNKAGFRIKIFPLSESNALRACAKIRASGELCEIPE